MKQKSFHSFITAGIQIEHLSISGLVIDREIVPFKSFTRSGWRWVCGSCLVGNFTGFLPPLTIAGATQTGTTRHMNGGTSRRTGIWIGSGDTDNTGLINDLVSPQDVSDWSFTTMEMHTEVSYRRIKYERIFTNTSGSSQDINEIGIYTSNSASSDLNLALFCRDILPTTRTVGNGESLRATYFFDSGVDGTVNFFRTLWRGHLDAGTNLFLVNLAGSNEFSTVSGANTNFRQLNGQSGETNRGIVIGDDDTANTGGSTWSLFNKRTTDIAHGAGSITQGEETATGAPFFATRTFLNETGSPMTIKEVAIYLQNGTSTTAISMPWRRALDEADWLTIADDEAATITLEFEAKYVPV